ncbi:MAG TPA: adenylate kinase [Candidatus Omnitrophota bacterium]|nr:adenylate kinase [Candidatus Omnitrophota bacterium]HQO57487.1 adenylate kinase [Candidatus Omnitrophota bacterium]
MNLVLLGPPGAGKGTFAGMIKESFELVHISTGDILREAMKSGSDLGRRVKSYVESGGLVPDELIIEIMEERLGQQDVTEHGYLLDGFPRTTAQAESLDRILDQIQQPIDLVVYMEAGLPVILQRLTGRRLCRKCNAIYHTVNMPPKKAGVCDHCGGELYQRPDDNEETITNRMKVYTQSTKPIVDYYLNQKKLHTFNAEKKTAELLNGLRDILNESETSNKDKVARRG